MKVIDLRCDALSSQSAEMLDAIKTMIPGDDVFNEDQSTINLENYVKDICDMEEALFVASGTMGNLLALLSHVGRGGEIIVGKNSHIFNLEASGASALGGIAFNTIVEKKGVMEIEDIRAAIRDKDIYSPRTRLICLENTQNLEGGIAIPVSVFEEIAQLSTKHGLPVHLDGARIFNACSLFNVSIKDYTKHVDSIMFSLTKGIGAPVGAVLAGTSELIAKARKHRKMIGGGMRQCGYLTAMGLVALKNNLGWLGNDNQRAKDMAKRISELQVFDVVISENMTNIVYMWLIDKKKDAREYIPELEQHGVKLLCNQRGFRAVLYHDISDDDVDRFCKTMKAVFN